jgi:hypothetical protein
MNDFKLEALAHALHDATEAFNYALPSAESSPT